MTPEVHQITKYQQIADLIEQRILSGELAHGAAVPSVRQMRGEYGASPDTARRALDLLRIRGLVTVRQGSSTTVVTPRTIAAPAVVAEALDVAEGRPMRMAVVSSRSVTLTLVD